MSAGPNPRSTTGSLDQLIALNDEIAALVRAGIPLDESLRQMGQEFPGRAGSIAWGLGERLRRGEPLEEVLASNPGMFPATWRAVVIAGLRAGNLAAALEGLSTAARRTRDLQQAIRVNCVYPLVVVAIAYVMFVSYVSIMSRAQAHIFWRLTRERDPLLQSLAALGETAWLWAFPVALLGGLLGWWCYRRAVSVGMQTATRRGFWSRRVAYSPTRLATFADLLSLLLRHQVPLTEAMRLAADATGDAKLKQAVSVEAARLEQGETLGEATPTSLPPVLHWLLQSRSAALLPESLQRIAERYRYRARRSAERTLVLVPLLFTVFVAGSATLLQVLLVLGPVYRILFRLT